MHFSSRTIVLLLALASCGAAACNDTTTTTTPTTTTTNTSETLTGTVTVNGAVTHQFSATSRGTVTATLNSLAPDANQTIGVSLGTWNGTTCQIILANDQAVVGAGVLGMVSGVGNLCLRVYDVGKLTGPETYTITVSHP